jgi:undecaprenyl diphosphate synthase
MSLKEEIDIKRIPSHVAIIMDGNGRWAKKRDLDRVYGHKQGVEAVRKVIEASAEIGIKYLTLYTFSTENWNRPEDEVSALMDLMIQSLNNETETLIKNNIRLMAIGNIERLSNDVKNRLRETMSQTATATGLNLIIAINYGSRWEITNAARKLSLDVCNGSLKTEDIDEKVFEKYLVTNGIPDPELLIRTSGELRFSNFLLWQLAYTELYFDDKLWPDFGKDDLYMALIEFQKRERRFGKTSENISE